MPKHNMTLHAQRRMQQRGINSTQIELLRAFGEDFYQEGGSYLTYIPTKKLELLKKALDSIATLALVKGDSDRIITAMHMHRRSKILRSCE